MSEYLNLNEKFVREQTKDTKPKKIATDDSSPRFFDREAKLLSHFDRITEWRNTGTTIPINVAIDPTFKCNHRCPGCHGLMGQDLSTIPTERLLVLIRELANLGVRGVMLGGAGDPSCHPDFGEILREFAKTGLEVGYYTNGELLKDDVIPATIDACRWVRFSLDADGPEIHQLVHKASPKAFDKIVTNMHRLHEERSRRESRVDMGAGYLVRPDTIKGLYGAAKLVRDVGWDYLRVRPFFGYDNKPLCNENEAKQILDELKRCEELNNDTFVVNYPSNRMAWVESGDPKITYTRCNVHHFSTHIGGDLKVYLCCHTIGWEKYCLGDLNEQTFAEIWNSEKRKKIYDNIDYRDCATPCSMGLFNELLNKFEAETIHTNFL